MKVAGRIVLFVLCFACGPMFYGQAAPATGRALLISDIHFDPIADPAIVKQLLATPVSQWDAIFRGSQQKFFPAFGSDTNYRLLASALDAAAEQAPLDYVVFTGDAIRHGNFPGKPGHTFLQDFLAAGGRADQFPGFVIETEAFVIQELQTRLKAPVVVALGNDDSNCGDYQIAPNSAFLAGTADALAILSGSEEAKRTFQLGGYYSIAHPTVANQEILVLNTVFWSASYKSCASNSGDPGEAEMEWLNGKLQNAKLLHHGVTLVMHIPPGMDAYTSAHGQCKTPTSFWQAKYGAEFSALMSSYSDVVQLELAGHTHMDDFRFVGTDPPSGTPALLPLRMTPSVSPIFKNDPAFSVVSYSLTTAAVSNIATYFLGLSLKPSASLWAKEYEFDGAYGVSGFSADNLSTIAAAIRSGTGSARATYEHNFAVTMPSGIHSSNFAFYSCAQDHFDAASYSNCVCGAAPVAKKVAQ